MIARLLFIICHFLYRKTRGKNTDVTFINGVHANSDDKQDKLCKPFGDFTI